MEIAVGDRVHYRPIGKGIVIEIAPPGGLFPTWAAFVRFDAEEQEARDKWGYVVFDDAFKQIIRVEEETDATES